jgi:hypothetical protein
MGNQPLFAVSIGKPANRGKLSRFLRYLRLAKCDLRGHIQTKQLFSTSESMMTTFDDRESGFEAKFAHDEAMQFKAQARANKLLGLWAAELMGLSGDEAAAYGVAVVKADFEEAGHEDVYRKVAGDLGDKADEATIRTKMIDCLAAAKQQILIET